jgi:hypothetical protein
MDETEETPREKFAFYVGMFAIVFPAMIASNFMPLWNVLPLYGWLGIATGGAGIAGAIATPNWLRGILAGALAGAGALMGMWLYVTLRAALTGNTTFLKIELVLGVLIGAAPGLWLYNAWARPSASDN